MIKDETPRQLVMAFNCGACTRECPSDQSMAEYARLEVGFTEDRKVQVWCVRHEMNVCVLVRPGPA